MDVLAKTLPLLFAAALAVTSKVYRWTDEQGGVHFGDAPPPEANAEQIRIFPEANILPSEGESEQAGLSAPGDDPLAAASKEDPAEACAQAVRDLKRFIPEWEQRARKRALAQGQSVRNIDFAKKVEQVRRTPLFALKRACVAEYDGGGMVFATCLAEAQDANEAALCLGLMRTLAKALREAVEQ